MLRSAPFGKVLSSRRPVPPPTHETGRRALQFSAGLLVPTTPKLYNINSGSNRGFSRGHQTAVHAERRRTRSHEMTDSEGASSTGVFEGGFGIQKLNFDQDETTPYHSAAACGWIGVLEAFLEPQKATSTTNSHSQQQHKEKEGEKPTPVDDLCRGRSALMLACSGGQVEVVRYLLKKGANPTLTDGVGWQPVHYACKAKHNAVELIKLLLSATAAAQEGGGSSHTTELTPSSSSSHSTRPKLNSLLHITNGKKWTVLHIASYYGSEATVFWLLEEFPEVVEALIIKRTDTDYIPLHCAAGNGSAEMVQALLKIPGADIEAKNHLLSTPLLLASHDKGREDIVKVLLDAGAHVNAQNRGRWTPLHCAAQGGALLSAKLLIEAGAGLESRNQGGWTPLMVAAHNNQPEMMQLLLSLGADLEAESSENWTAMHLAGGANAIDSINVLLQAGARVDPKNLGGWTPLQVTLQKKGIASGFRLLEAGADPNSQNSAQWAALHIAVNAFVFDGDHVKRMLTEFGADPNLANEGGWTPLQLAAQSGNIGAFYALLEAGADPKVRNDGNWTTLHMAAQKGDIQMLYSVLYAGSYYEGQEFKAAPAEKLQEGEEDKILDSAEASAKNEEDTTHSTVATSKQRFKQRNMTVREINQPNLGGWTALHCAAHGGYPELVNALIEAGADINQRNGVGWTPFHLAANHGHVNVCQMLHYHQADPLCLTAKGWTILHCATQFGKYEATLWILQNTEGVLPIDSRSQEGWTSLHSGCHKAGDGNAAVTRLLLDWGADVHARNNGRWTPLHCASHCGCMGSAKALVEAGADLSARTDRKRSVSDTARYHGQKQMLQYLLEMGAPEPRKFFKNNNNNNPQRGGGEGGAGAMTMPNTDDGTVTDGAISADEEKAINWRLEQDQKKKKEKKKSNSSRPNTRRGSTALLATFSKVLATQDAELEMRQISTNKLKYNFTARWKVAEWLHLTLGSTLGPANDDSKLKAYRLSGRVITFPPSANINLPRSTGAMHPNSLDVLLTYMQSQLEPILFRFRDIIDSLDGRIVIHMDRTEGPIMKGSSANFTARIGWKCFWTGDESSVEALVSSIDGIGGQTTNAASTSATMEETKEVTGSSLYNLILKIKRRIEIICRDKTADVLNSAKRDLTLSMRDDPLLQAGLGRSSCSSTTATGTPLAEDRGCEVSTLFRDETGGERNRNKTSSQELPQSGAAFSSNATASGDLLDAGFGPVSTTTLKQFPSAMNAKLAAIPHLNRSHTSSGILLNSSNFVHKAMMASGTTATIIQEDCFGNTRSYNAALTVDVGGADLPGYQVSGGVPIDLK